MIDKIYNSDALDILKSLPDNSIDLVCTDPPYGIDYADWDSSLEFEKFTEDWFLEVKRVLKPNGSFWCFMSHHNVVEVISIGKKYFNFHTENWVVWARQKGRSSSKHLKSTREDILHFTKGDKFTWNNIQVLRKVIAPYKVNGVPRGWFVNELGIVLDGPALEMFGFIQLHSLSSRAI